MKIIVIVGPTASGKSELAVTIAKKYNGEVISADSRQIYRGLTIGTGKVAGTWRKNVFLYKRVPHYCIDFLSPRKTFNVSEFKKCAVRAIRDIASRGKIPILAGGTGFWIDAVIYDFTLPEVPPNSELRKQLAQKTPVQLLKILARLDQKRSKTIDQKNPRRLIRAIEIAAALGRVPKLKKRSPYQTLWLGLKPSYEVQPRKIAERTREMIRRGLIAETKRLLAAGITKKRIGEFGFEYRASLDFARHRIQRDQLPKRIVKNTLAYAKRQMTWWKRNPEIRWIKTAKAADRLLDAFAVPIKRYK